MSVMSVGVCYDSTEGKPRRRQDYSLVAHAIQTIRVDEAKVAGMHNGSGIMHANKTVEFVVCAWKMASATGEGDETEVCFGINTYSHP